MKLTSQATQVTNATSSAAAFTFDRDGLGKLMTSLSNVYRDSYGATLREYAVNALDSHRAAGNPAPIEVTLPSDFDPTLTVTDHGVGMSEDEVLNLYCAYGGSTKRETNTQVGAFGIGAKAAFTITPGWHVTAIKDGRKVVAEMHLSEDGTPTVRIVHRAATDEANGVTVQIPVDKPAAMQTAAEAQFPLWEQGTVVVDGQESTPLIDSLTEIAPGIYATNDLRGPHVIMGGIRYSLGDVVLTSARELCDRTVSGPDRARVARVLQLWSGRHSFGPGMVVFAEVGQVDITPAREDVRDTPRTVQFVLDATTTFVRRSSSALQTLLDQEPTLMRAALRLPTLRPLLPDTHTLPNGAKPLSSWRGAPIRDGEQAVGVVRVERRNEKGCEWDHHSHMTTGQHGQSAHIVTGLDDTTIKSVRAYARRYLHAHNLDALYLVRTGATDLVWLDVTETSAWPVMTVQEFITAARGLPGLSSAPRRATTYDVILNGAKLLRTASEVRKLAEDGMPVVGVHSHSDWQFARTIPGLLSVLLDGNKTMNGLQRWAPDAVAFGEIAADHAREQLAHVTEQERAAIAACHIQTLESAKRLDRAWTERHVPALAAALRRYEAEKDAEQHVPRERQEQVRRLLELAGEPVRPRAHDEVPELADYPLLVPLLRHWTRRDTPTVLAHMRIYVAAVDAANDQNTATAA